MEAPTGPSAPRGAEPPPAETAPDSRELEQREKEARLRGLLRERGLDAVVLRRASSFAWATAGVASYINTAADAGEATLVVTRDARYLVANTIEAPRFEREAGLRAQGWEFVTPNWWETGAAVARVVRGLRVGADAPFEDAEDLAGEVAQLRTALVPDEGARFRDLAGACAAAMDAAIRRVRPGQTEHEIAALLASESVARNAWPVVDLVATDERIARYRHPLPTDKRLERHAMLVLCGRRAGLVCSITRFVHFGALPDALRTRQDACARVDAAMIHATRPGAAVRDVFARAVRAYTSQGFADEWHLHHQGGAAGYEPREYVATPASNEVVREGQAFAWNPSITGTKSEDTVLVGARRCEVLTAIADWPTIPVTVEGETFARPAVLELR
jgi:Xaa-Pro aminopeptidase